MKDIKPGEIINVPNVEWIAMPVSDYTEAIKNNITLRDFFAGCALIGLFAHKGDGAIVDRTAYEVADAMLKAREE